MAARLARTVGGCHDDGTASKSASRNATRSTSSRTWETSDRSNRAPGAQIAGVRVARPFDVDGDPDRGKLFLTVSAHCRHGSQLRSQTNLAVTSSPAGAERGRPWQVPCVERIRVPAARVSRARSGVAAGRRAPAGPWLLQRVQPRLRARATARRTRGSRWWPAGVKRERVHPWIGHGEPAPSPSVARPASGPQSWAPHRRGEGGRHVHDSVPALCRDTPHGKPASTFRARRMRPACGVEDPVVGFRFRMTYSSFQ